MSHFAIVFKTRVVPSDQQASMVQAVRLQLVTDVCPAWDREPVDVVLYTSPERVPDDGMLIVVQDSIDVDGALAYHTEVDGKVSGIVDAALAVEDGVDPCVDLSHEVVEAFLDPACNSVYVDESTGSEYDGEMADRVQDQSYLVSPGLPPVSNFVRPAWCDRQAVADFDHLGSLSEPFTRTPGGYMMVSVGGRRVQMGTRPNRKLRTLRTLRHAALHGAEHTQAMPHEGLGLAHRKARHPL